MRRLAITLLAGVALQLPAQAALTVFADESAFHAALGSASTTMVDFEGAPWIPDTTYGNAVVHQGITWTAGQGLRASSFHPHSGQVALSDEDGSPDAPDLLQAVFAADQGAVGFWLRAGIGLVSLEMQLLDRQGLAVGSHQSLVGEAWTFFGLASDSPWATLQVRANTSQIRVDDFLLDDLIASPALLAPPVTVPEPAGTGLVAMALAAAAVQWRRRRGGFSRARAAASSAPPASS